MKYFITFLKFHKFLKMDVPKKWFLNHLLTLIIHKRVLLVVHNLTQRTVKFFQNFLCSWTSWVLLSRPQLVRNHFLASLPKRRQDDMFQPVAHFRWSLKRQSSDYYINILSIILKSYFCYWFWKDCTSCYPWKTAKEKSQNIDQ